MTTAKKSLILLLICGFAFLYFALNKIDDFDYQVDEPLWVHLSKIQENHGIILDTEFAPPLPFWINGLALKITKNNLAPRYMSILIFIATLIITYRLLDNLQITRTKKMLFMSALLINPYFILYSRTAMTDIHYFSFMWLSILSLYIYLEKKEKKYITLSGIFFSLSALTKHISLVFYPLFIIAMMTLQKKRKLTKKDILTFLAYSSIGFIFLGAVDIAGFLKTGETYSFLSRLIKIVNILPFIEIASNKAQGTLITEPAMLVGRAIKYTTAILLYTFPFIPLLIKFKINKNKKTAETLLTPDQKHILAIILGMLSISIFLTEGYMRQLIVIYPLTYLFVIKNTKINALKAFSIFAVWCLIINIYAFSLFDTKIFGSSRDYLEDVADTKLQMFEYINSNTDKNDIVITNIYPDIMNAKESILTSISTKSPPENAKYIMYDPEAIKDKKEKQEIENNLKYHDLEKTFEYKNITEHYIYKVNKTRWDSKEKRRPISPVLMFNDIIK
ncbi:MAG: glycosyltransferase family 39 protein [archaeon]